MGAFFLFCQRVNFILSAINRACPYFFLAAPLVNHQQMMFDREAVHTVSAEVEAIEMLPFACDRIPQFLSTLSRQ